MGWVWSSEKGLIPRCRSRTVEEKATSSPRKCLWTRSLGAVEDPMHVERPLHGTWELWCASETKRHMSVVLLHSIGVSQRMRPWTGLGPAIANLPDGSYSKRKATIGSSRAARCAG